MPVCEGFFGGETTMREHDQGRGVKRSNVKRSTEATWRLQRATTHIKMEGITQA